MSFLDQPFLNDGGADEAPSSDSSFTKGLRSGVTTLKGQVSALAGGVGEALGADDFARERYARSKELQEQAAAEAPPIHSYKDVHDLKSGYDYVTGLVGQSAPLAAGAIGSALVTKRPFMAPTAVMSVPETGDIIERQQNDPASLRVDPTRRLLNAAASGTASAAVQSLAPGAVASQVAGKTAATAAKLTAGDLATRATGVAGVNAAGAAAGEASKQAGLHQSNQDLPYDTEAIKEAGVGGAVAGTAMAVPGAIAEGTHGAASRAGTSVTGAVKGAVAGAKERATAASEGLFKKGSDEATAKAIADDVPLDPLPPGADPSAHVAASDAKATTWATAKAQEIIGSDYFPEAMKAKAAELLPKVSDFAARSEIAAMDLTMKAKEQATDFYDTMSKVAGDAKDKIDERLKKSADYSGVREMIAKELVPAIEKNNPYALKDPATLNSIVDGILLYVDHVHARQDYKLGENPKAVMFLRSILGDDALPVFDKIFRAVDSGDQAKNEALYSSLLSFDEVAGAHDKMADVVKKNMVANTDPHVAVEALRKYVRGEHVKDVQGPQSVVREKIARKEIENIFGKNTDKVLDAFQKEHEIGRAHV